MYCKDHLHGQKLTNCLSIGNLDDKRQITGTFVVNLSGEYLPIQMVYTGTTDLCHPKVNFPTGFDVIPSANH